jgi:hypothetical protein
MEESEPHSASPSSPALSSPWDGSKASAVESPNAIEVFISYSHVDTNRFIELGKYLKVLKKRGMIIVWDSRRITAGKEWEGQIKEKLNSAGIILLLVSIDFLASDYISDVELKRAMERHEAVEARVIPVILRPCDWQAESFGKLEAVPKDSKEHIKPVSKWPLRDDAFNNVAARIKEVVEELRKNSALSSTAKAKEKTGAERAEVSQTTNKEPASFVN